MQRFKEYINRIPSIGMTLYEFNVEKMKMILK